MKPWTSLRGRLLTSATVCLVAFLGMMGFVLEEAFSSSARAAVEARLMQQIYGLLSVTEDSEMGLILPIELADPLMNQLGSGHYAVILDDQRREIWRSQSALDQNLSSAWFSEILKAGERGEARFGSLQGASDNLLFLAYRVQWESEALLEEFDFVVFEQDSLLAAEVVGFRARLWSWLVAIVLVLILLQFLVMRWGLKPIAIFTRDIDAIAQGRSQSLSGDYPDELKPLAQTLNRLVDQEQAQRERYRLTLADLAHSLKTPLSIIRNSLSVSKDESVTWAGAKEIDRQVEQMDQLVAYQLERAVIASSPLVKAKTQSQGLLSGLIEALQKVYVTKNVQLEINFEADECFADARDLQQMWGNLLDNAFKYCETRVRVALHRRGGQLILQVEDDGPGIAEAMRDQVLARGFRLDTQAQGQGIGLAVVIEIAARYDGTLTIDQAEDFGGASFELALAVI